MRDVVASHGRSAAREGKLRILPCLSEIVVNARQDRKHNQRLCNKMHCVKSVIKNTNPQRAIDFSRIEISISVCLGNKVRRLEGHAWAYVF